MAIANELQSRYTIDEFDVPSGTWIVGKHIKSGTYSIRPASGAKKNSNIHYEIKTAQIGNNSMMLSGEAESGFPSHVVLRDGDTITINYSGVSFSTGILFPSFTGVNASLNVLPVAEIADFLGYSSSASFINAFRMRRGISPNQYRKLYAGRRSGTK